MTEILITSSVLILALLALRKVFRNSLSRRVQYALWGLVLLRLLVPVSLPAVDFSVLTAAKPVEQTVTQRVTARPVYVPIARAPLAEHPAAPDIAPERTQTPVGGSVWVAATDETAVQYKSLSIRTVLSAVRLAGSAVSAVWLLAVNLRFRRQLRRTRIPWDTEGCALPVYLVEEGLSSPCLFGLFRPAIYLTPAALASPERLRHVLAHETTHARHLDHLWTLLRGICLAVYWFDPLVWVASAAAGTDCELACDEGTLARLEETDRIPYGQTLLSLIPMQRTASPMLAATTMAAGKKQLKDRITRIAQKQRQLVAAAVAAALLAGVVSACTFTGAVTPDGPGEAQEDAGLQALTGEELRWFTEVYFNDPGFMGVYNIRNQFANPINLYEKPEDINLFELFYCDGAFNFSDVELKAALGVEPWELPFPVYKLTTEDIDRILTQYLGLTLEQTNKAGLGQFTYLPEYDAYYWMHGDTNYPDDLDFTVGTRVGKTVTLYQNSYYAGGWYSVKLEEQEDGSYHFLSNQRCEKPAIPTPMPAGEPETVISLSDAEPYDPAPGGVAIESRAGDFDGNLENLWANQIFAGQNVVIYRAVDGTVNAAIRNGDIMNVFLSDIGDSRIDFFNDLFGRDGFTVTYYGQVNENPRAFGTVVDYYFFAEDGVLELLARSANTFGESPRIDLDGDGRDELISEAGLIFQRDDGSLCRADLYSLVLDSCGAMDAWFGCTLDRYSKCLLVSGYGYTQSDMGRDVFRWLYFDGEQLLLYKQEKPHHDHVVDGIEQYVPEAIIAAARDYVEREVIVAQPDGTWRHAGYQEEGYPQETYDDWRIESIRHEETETVGDMTLDKWTFNYELHTIDPENVVLAGGKYLTEDDWVSPGYPGCDWLFFRVTDGDYTLLWHSMINDMSPGTELFQEYVREHLAR